MNETVKILIAGDYVPKRTGAAQHPISKDIKDLFQAADYVIVNLEAPLTEVGSAIEKTGGNYKLNPEHAQILRDSGVKCVALANNHIRDFGDSGVLETIKACRAAGLETVGAGANLVEASTPLILVVKGLRIGIVNFCEQEFSIASDTQAGANPYDPITAYYSITQLRAEVDALIVVYHGGLEYLHYPTPEMVRVFRYLVDLGADTVVAHHAHAYSGYETYKGKSICYGLGNFVSYTANPNPRESWFKGLIAEIEFADGKQRLTTHSTIMDAAQNSVRLTFEEETKSTGGHLDQINGILSDEAGFNKIWADLDREGKQTFFRIMASRSNFHARLLKRIRIFRSKPTKYQARIWLNVFRCDALRYRAIRLLKSESEPGNS